MLTHKQLIPLLLYLLMDQELWPHLASCHGSQNCRTFWETRLQTCLKLTKQSFSLPDHLFFSPSSPPSLLLTLPSPVFLQLASPQWAPKSKSVLHLLAGSWWGWREEVGLVFSRAVEAPCQACPLPPTPPPRILFGSISEPEARQAFFRLRHCSQPLSVSSIHQCLPPLSSVLSMSSSNTEFAKLFCWLRVPGLKGGE